MKPPINQIYEYQVGGCLTYDASSYIEREADNILIRQLSAGEFCYIFNSRQMGKSSLRVRTMSKLRNYNNKCTSIDISEFCSADSTKLNWYAGITNKLSRNLGLNHFFDFRQFWNNDNCFSPLQKLAQFIDEILLNHIHQPIIIFFDEVDSVLSLDFSTDEFFAYIRSCYNKRAEDSRYKRLIFCLLGVITPSDLIQDKQRTPFNIGRAIPLSGLQFEQAKPLANGLVEFAQQPEVLLQEILHWTAGQPFLTQKLCRLICECQAFVQSGDETAYIEKLVHSHVITNWESQDEPPHFRTIRDRLLRDESKAARVLSLYQQLLDGADVPINDSAEQLELRLSGLVCCQTGFLRLHNPIYAAIFNIHWTQVTLANLRPYASAISAWTESDCQDESCLLQSDALDTALTWSTHKSLSPIDYQFLSASQDLNNRKIQAALVAEKQANQILHRAHWRARRIIVGTVALTVIAVGLSGIGVAIVTAEARGKVTEAQGEVRELRSEAQSQLEQQKKLEKDRQNLQAEIASLQQLKSKGQKELDAARSEMQSLKQNAQSAEVIAHQLQSQIVQAEVRQKELQQDILNTESVLNVVERHSRLIQLEQNSEQLDQIQSLFQVLAITQDLKRHSPDTEGLFEALWQGYRFIESLLSHFQAVNQFDTQQAEIFAIDIASSSQQIITGDADGVIALWSINGHLLRTWKADTEHINDLQFSPDEQTIVAVGYSGKVQLWSLQGEKQFEWTKFDGEIYATKILPNSQSLVIAGEKGKVGILAFDQNRYISLSNSDKHRNLVIDIAISPTGDMIATGDIDGKVILWNRNGDQLAKFEQLERVLSLAFSPDGKQLLIGGGDGARVWSISGSAKINDVNHPERGRYRALQVAFSNDGNFLITAGDRTIQIWDRTTYTLVNELDQHQGAVNALALFSNNDHFVSAGDDGMVRLWDLAALNNSRIQVQASSSEVLPDAAIRLDPQNRIIATAAKGHLAFGNQRNLTAFDSDVVEQGENSTIIDIDISPNQQRIATISLDEIRGTFVQIRDRSDGKILRSWQPNQGRIAEARFSPDNQHIATAGFNGIEVYDTSSGRLVSRFSTPDRMATSLVFSPNNEQIIVVFDDGQLEWWRWQDQTRLRELKAHDGWAVTTDMSPDGQLLATSGEDGQIKIWSQSGVKLATVSENSHVGIVRAVQFSPNGNMLATAGDDGYIKIWWIQNGDDRLDVRLMQEFSLRQGVKGIDFSADGRQLASITDAGEVTLWQIPDAPDLDRAVATACSRLRFYLQTHPAEQDKLTICADTPR
ncbi:MAG: AAA-like domain-containing protein [Thainema sp.]